MSKQSKATDRRILRPIRMILILLLALLIPPTGYTEDMSEDMIKAAWQGDTATVRALLGKGTDVNARGNRGRTALIGAAERGHTETVQVLLDKGADVNARGGHGLTPLTWATRGGHTDIIRLLKEAGAKE